MNIKKIMAEAQARHDADEVKKAAAGLGSVAVEVRRTKPADPDWNALRETRSELVNFWAQVADAMLVKNPNPDEMVIDEEGKKRIRQVVGNSRRGHIRYDIVDKILIPRIIRRHAIPAWDMRSVFRQPEKPTDEEDSTQDSAGDPVRDPFQDSVRDSVRFSRLYLSGNGLVQFGLVEEGETGVCRGMEVIEPGDITDETPAYSAESQGYKEAIATGLANLVAKYELPVSV